MSINTNLIKTKTTDIKKLLSTKGIKVSNNYQNLHLLPIFQNKIGYDKIFLGF